MLGVWLGTSVRFVINLTVTPALYIIQERLSGPLAKSVAVPGRRSVMAYCSAQLSRHFVRMVPYAQNENDGGHLELCAVCDAVMAGWAEGNTVCATCGAAV